MWRKQSYRYVLSRGPFFISLILSNKHKHVGYHLEIRLKTVPCPVISVTALHFSFMLSRVLREGK